MASLYELSAEYAAVVDAYDAAETDEEREALLVKLDGLCCNLSEQAEAYARLIRNKKAEALGFKSEIDRLTARKRAAENLVERLENTMLDAMNMTGQREVWTSIGKWRVQMNPWSCEVVDVDRVPKEFRTPQPDKVDRKALTDHFKATGEIIDGVEFKQVEGIRFR